MPQYSISIPGKGTFRVESPTELTDAQAYAAVLQNMPAEEKEAPFSLKDTLLNFGQSALGATKAATDVFGAANPASQALERGQQSLSGMMSPETRAEMAADAAREAEAAKEGPMAEAGAALETIKKSPVRTLAQAGGSIIPTLTSLFIPGVGPARAAMAARTAYMTALAIAQGAGAVKGTIYDNVKAQMEKTGVSPEEAAKIATEAQNYMGENYGQILTGAGIGAVTGRLGLENILAGRAKGTLAPIAGEMLTEGLQGGQQQYAGNVALQKVGADVDPFAGVAGAATKEGIMGGLGAGVVSPFIGRETVAGATPTAGASVASPYGEAVELGTTPKEAEPVAEAGVETPEVAQPAAKAAAAPAQLDRGALQTQVDTLEQQLSEASISGDTATIKSLFPEYVAAKKALATMPAPEGEPAPVISTAALDAQIKDTQKKLSDAGTLGEFNKVKPLSEKLDKLKEQRAAADVETEEERAAAPTLRKETPAAEPVYTAEEAAPKAEEVLVEEEPVVKKTRAKKVTPVEEAVEEEEAAAPAEEVVAAPAPKKPRAKKDKTPVDSIALFDTENEVRAEASNREEPPDEVAIKKETLDRFLRRLDPALEPNDLVSTRGVYDETYDKSIGEIETLRNKIAKPIGNAKRSVLDDTKDLYEEYLLVDQELQTGKVQTMAESQAGTFTSFKQLESAPLQRYVEGKPLTKRQIADRTKRRDTLAKKLAEKNTFIDRVQNRIAQIYAGMHSVKRKKTESEKEAELRELGTSPRALSREAKLTKKVNEGKVAASAERVAREVGDASEQFKTETAEIKQQIDAKQTAFSAYEAKANQKLKDMREKLGEQSETYKDAVKNADAEIGKRKQALAAFKQTVQKSKAYKTDSAAAMQRIADKEASVAEYETETKQKLQELRKTLGEQSETYKTARKNATIEIDKRKKVLAAFKQVKEFGLKDRAIAIGKASPKFAEALGKANKAYKKSEATAGEQEIKSLRTPQETRKLAKLGTMTTGSTESREASARRQAGFERGISDIYGDDAEIARAARLDELKSRAKKPAATAMEGAMREAAMRKIASDMAQGVEREEGTGPVFRTGKSDGVIDPAEAKGFIVKLRSNMPAGIDFTYEPTLDGISEATMKRLVAEGYKPGTAFKGVVLSDGKVIVVGDQHANLKDLEETVVHELIGHYGIDTVIGLDKLETYAAKTDLEKLSNDLGGDRLWTDVVAAMRFASEQKGNTELAGLREIIAYTAQRRVDESFREKAGRFIKELVGMVRSGLRRMGFTKASEMSTSDVFYAIKLAQKAYDSRKIGPYRAADGTMAFRTKKEPTTLAQSFVYKEPSKVDNFFGNVLGLRGRVAAIDKYAAVSEAFAKGKDAGVISSLEAEQAEYYLRLGEQRSQFATQALTNGRLALFMQKTPRGNEVFYKSVKGANMVQVADALAKSKVGNGTQQEAMFTAYLVGNRAKDVGWDKVNMSNPAQAEKEYDAVMAELAKKPEAEKAFKEAARIYQEYNNGLIDLLVQTGAMKSEVASKLKAINYVPFYRVKDGDIQLEVDSAQTVKIGNIKDEPHLAELLGGNGQIMPVFASAVQNTFMLTDMALRNQAIKDTSLMLKRIGIVSRIGEGSGPRDANTIRFKIKGVDHFATIDTDMYGVPAKLIVHGLEGIKTSLPKIVEFMGMPANFLRKMITRSPAYSIRQLIRDPMTAWMTTGVSGVPVLNAFKEMATALAGRNEAQRKLMESGAISTNVLTGDRRDMEKILREISSGNNRFAKVAYMAMAKLDAFAMQADAATRSTVYRDSINKGMSDMQAILRTLESMNFSRKGTSASMQWLSVIIPFFNAQVQGLDVMYRAFTGKMPYNEQLKIRQKLYARGAMLAIGTVAYALAMQDDESYRRATPEQRLGNWFVPDPFGGKEMLRIPIPFEFGYIFKSLPEAIINMAAKDSRGKDITEGMKSLVWMSVPLSLPAAIKPATEVILGKSFFGGDIESQREVKTMNPETRYRPTTSEVAKLIGSVTGKISDKLTPIKLDYLIRGHTGGMGAAIVALANPILNDEADDVPKPTKTLSKNAFIGGMYQPVDGRGTIDAAYDRMLEIQQAKSEYVKLLRDGEKERAKEFLTTYRNLISSASVSGSVQQKMGELATLKRAIIASPKLTQEQKDERLEKITKAQQLYADRLLTLSEKR